MYANWNCLFFYLLLLFSMLLVVFYNFKISQKKVSFLWFLNFSFLYICFFLFIVIVLIFCYGKFLLFFLFNQYNIQTVLRDPQEILNLVFSFGLWIFLFFIVGSCSFYLNLFISNLLRQDEYNYYNFIWKLSLYFFSLSFLFLFFDLLSFHTDVFSQQQLFKFEPEILKWYQYYESEYVDLIIALFFILVLYILSINNKYITYGKKLRGLRFWYFIVFSTFFFYFLGGESFIRDFNILLGTFVVSEIIHYTLLLFSFLKRYK